MVRDRRLRAKKLSEFTEMQTVTNGQFYFEVRHASV
jgi:hypothetical protein